jgi:hypothetical protein
MYAQFELDDIDEGLRAYQAENDSTAFPFSNMITSYNDLFSILFPYVKLSPEEEMHWTFVSYNSSSPDTYELKVVVKDKWQTRITAWPGGTLVLDRTKPPPLL